MRQPRAASRRSGGDAQGLDHLGFIVPTIAEVEAGYAWAKSIGIEIVHALKHHRDGSVSFYIRDPDGNVIQALYEPTISPQSFQFEVGPNYDSPKSCRRRNLMMLKGRATAEATATYASRFPTLPGNFRRALGVSVSSIGIGTYLGETDDETDRAYEEAINASLRGGINLIDTAVNYRFQRSERISARLSASWSRRARSRARK